MFRRLYNKIIIPVIVFLLPGISLMKLFKALIIAIVVSVVFYRLVFPRVNNKEWLVYLAGFGATFIGILATRTIANLINNFLCNRREVLIAASKEKLKSNR